MSSSQGKYNIKAVSNMLDIQSGTLRAWERRYQIIRPIRNDAGHRLYTEEHIQTLKWLIDKIEKGFTISQAVSLFENSGDVLPYIQSSNNLEKGNQFQAMEEELLEALLSFDEKQSQIRLDYAFSIFSPETVAIQILGPVLLKIGDLWGEGKITSAHEHFASNFLRSRIGMLFFSMGNRQGSSKAICVGGPGEKHELGLLIFTIFLKNRGYDVVYLGQSIAGEDVEAVIEEVQPNYLFMSCSMTENISTTVTLVGVLQERFPGLHIGLGGYAFDSMPDQDKATFKNHLLGDTNLDWEEWLSART